MANAMTGTLDVTKTGNDYTDEYGDLWCYVADDMRGHVIVDREDGEAAGEIFESQMKLYARNNGDTFDVSNPREFIVENDGWVRNEL